MTFDIFDILRGQCFHKEVILLFLLLLEVVFKVSIGQFIQRYILPLYKDISRPL